MANDDNNNSNLDNTTLKSSKAKPWILIISAMVLLLVFAVTLYFYISSNKEAPSNAYPFASRMIEDELFSSTYEMAIVYSGNLDTLSDPTADYMEQIYFDWCDNTNVPPEITTMKVSFYKTEEEASRWLEPQKSTYFFR